MSYFLANGKSFYSLFLHLISPNVTKAPFLASQPDTGAGMAILTFFLFSDAHYFDSVICQKKLSMSRMTC